MEKISSTYISGKLATLSPARAREALDGLWASIGMPRIDPRCAPEAIVFGLTETEWKRTGDEALPIESFTRLKSEVVYHLAGVHVD